MEAHEKSLLQDLGGWRSSLTDFHPDEKTLNVCISEFATLLIGHFVAVHGNMAYPIPKGGGGSAQDKEEAEYLSRDLKTKIRSLEEE